MSGSGGVNEPKTAHTGTLMCEKKTNASTGQTHAVFEGRPDAPPSMSVTMATREVTFVAHCLYQVVGPPEKTNVPKERANRDC